MTPKQAARLAELRLARRRDINRMSPEEADAAMDAISEYVGKGAHAMDRNYQEEIGHLYDEANERKDMRDRLSKAWSKWDWKVLANLGLVSRDDYKFVQDFFGEYSR